MCEVKRISLIFLVWIADRSLLIFKSLHTGDLVSVEILALSFKMSTQFYPTETRSFCQKFSLLVLIIGSSREKYICYIYMYKEILL